MSGKQDKQRVILSLTVEIQDGREEHIEVREGDSAELVAKRFVSEHLLPGQFEAPLAELIVDNIIRLSKDDKWRNKADHQRPPPSRSATDDRKFGKHKQQGRRLSDRLLSQTYTFRAKTSVFGHLEPGRKPKLRPLSDKEKALCIRLHADFMKHREKMEEERKNIDAQYVDKMNKGKVRATKRSKRLMSMRGAAARQFNNYGELLYQDGVAKLQQKRILMDKKREELLKNELTGVTWKPEISDVARKLKQEEDVWRRLTKDTKIQERLQELRNEVIPLKPLCCCGNVLGWSRLSKLRSWSAPSGRRSTRWRTRKMTVTRGLASISSSGTQRLDGGGRRNTLSGILRGK